MNKVTQYYDATAEKYDNLHCVGGTEHITALDTLVPKFFADCNSVLDIGCGTGRALSWFHKREPRVELSGIDPSQKLLEIAATKVPSAALHQGGGEKLPFEDNSFDLVMMTGILHHIEDTKQTIREAFRVARVGVLISDHNNFAFGSLRFRKFRLFLYSLGLLPLATYIKQGFSKQGYSEEDGYWYPYSLLSDFDVISEHSQQYFVTPTIGCTQRYQSNLFLSQTHMAVACLK